MHVRNVRPKVIADFSQCRSKLLGPVLSDFSVFWKSFSRSMSGWCTCYV